MTTPRNNLDVVARYPADTVSVLTSYYYYYRVDDFTVVVAVVIVCIRTRTSARLLNCALRVFADRSHDEGCGELRWARGTWADATVSQTHTNHRGGASTDSEITGARPTPHLNTADGVRQWRQRTMIGAAVSAGAGEITTFDKSLDYDDYVSSMHHLLAHSRKGRTKQHQLHRSSSRACVQGCSLSGPRTHHPVHCRCCCISSRHWRCSSHGAVGHQHSKGDNSRRRSAASHLHRHNAKAARPPCSLLRAHAHAPSQLDDQGKAFLVRGSSPSAALPP